MVKGVGVVHMKGIRGRTQAPLRDRHATEQPSITKSK